MSRHYVIFALMSIGCLEQLPASGPTETTTQPYHEDTAGNLSILSAYPVSYHWRDEAGDIFSATPDYKIFGHSGSVWSVNTATGEVTGQRVSTIFYTGTACTGTAYIQAPPLMQALDILGQELMRPPGTSVPELVSILSVGREEGIGVEECYLHDDTLILAVRVSNLVDAGPPPARTWAGGIYPVEGSP